MIVYECVRFLLVCKHKYENCNVPSSEAASSNTHLPNAMQTSIIGHAIWLITVKKLFAFLPTNLFWEVCATRDWKNQLIIHLCHNHLNVSSIVWCQNTRVQISSVYWRNYFGLSILFAHCKPCHVETVETFSLNSGNSTIQLISIGTI